MKIGICDDDAGFRQGFAQQVREVLGQLGIKGEFVQWASLKEAKSAMEQQERVDLLFLDIELETRKGMDLGRFMRKELLDYQTQIVYVSYEPGYAMELFDSEPLGFLIKPVSEEELVQVCSRYLQRKKIEVREYYYKDGMDAKVLVFDETLYFQSMGHKLLAYTTSGIKEFYGKLTELEAQAPAYFIRIHKSYLVNTHYIQCYHPGKVVLNNQEELVISRSHKEAVRTFVSKRLEEM